jgi:hypothetical protein
VKCALLGWMAWKDATSVQVDAAVATNNEEEAARDRAGSRPGPGPKVLDTPTAGDAAALPAEDDVIEAMKDVVDPSWASSNVVDLGLSTARRCTTTARSPST